ncbi:MAG TPA: class III extradiol ring-cleavage dioxygenase [Kofleriaceae bacterium]
MPTVYIPHGGGPWPWVHVPFGSQSELDALKAYLSNLASIPGEAPKALLVISAHWEENVPTVMTSAHPPMLYDYYGFPPESYSLQWPAPGAPQLVARVKELLAAAKFPLGEDPDRGFDHGTFVPLKLAYPEPQIPVLQLSLVTGLDPATHLALGRALAPLRDEGVFIIGSGMSYHNLRAFHPSAEPHATQFDNWLKDTATRPQAERDAALTSWAKAPSARAVHPREEHLIPLMVVAGAAGEDAGKLAWNGSVNKLKLSAYHFGG